MLTKLRRWHFDLALFLGLAIFSWAYWYSKPRPAWTSYYTLKDNGARNNYLNLLGYSADSQSIYTSCETTVVSKNWPIPQIQRWDMLTGELLENYPVELPEEDRFQLRLPKQNFDSSYTITLCSDPRYFMLRFHQSRQKDHHYLRLYRIDGKPVGQGLEVPHVFRVDYIPDPTKNDRHWVLSYELRSASKELPIKVINLDTGKTVCTIDSPPTRDLDTFPSLSGGRYLVIKKKSKKGGAKNTELIDIQTGESIGQLTTAAGRANDMAPVDEMHWAVCTMFGDFNNFTTHLDMFRYDPQAKTFELDPLHPLNGISSGQNEWIALKPPLMIFVGQSGESRNDSPVMKTILSWLARIGINRDETSKINYRIFDVATGQPLRQISGLPAHINTTNTDFRYVAATTQDPSGEPSLCLYLIPHHLWETTLSWLQWLAWLLVIPWPLRYFLPTHLAPGSSSRGAI